MQGFSFNFDGFFVELMGISSSLKSTMPYLSLTQSSFRQSLDDPAVLDTSFFDSEMFIEEAINMKRLYQQELSFNRSELLVTADDNSAMLTYCKYDFHIHNIFYIGGNMSKSMALHISSPTDCCYACYQTPPCLAWSFMNSPFHQCFLKGADIKSQGPQELKSSNSISGNFLENKGVVRRNQLPKVLVFHGTSCFYRNMTIGSTVKRSIDTFWIGRFMLERADFSKGMRQEEYGVLQCAAMMDEIWVPTDYMKTIFLRLLHDIGVRHPNIAVIPEAVDTTLFDPTKANRNRFRYSNYQKYEINITTTNSSTTCHSQNDTNEDIFEFLSIFKWEYRKGWDILLTAYWTAFNIDDPVVLRLRTYVPSFDKGNKNITARIESFARETFNKSLQELPPVVWDRNTLTSSSSSSSPTNQSSSDFLTRYDIRDLLASADAFVLPTRGEGWGLPISEAMAMALPVIVTNCTGPAAFVDEKNAYLIPVHSDSYDDKGFSVPDTAILVNMMRQVIADSKEILEISPGPGHGHGHTVTRSSLRGNKARQRMEEISPDFVVEKMASQIRALAAHRGWKNV
eukprot:gene5920-11948_t